MRYYKLTDENCRTHSDTKWGEGVTHKAIGKGKELCTEDVIHVYDHPLKAAMFNPIQANFNNPILWECKVKKVIADDQLKVGVKECTTIKQIELPEITINQRVRFAIRCALEVYKDKNFVKWAEDWLSGKDRTAGAAGTAAEAGTAAWAAVWAAGRDKIDFVALIKKAIRDEVSDGIH